MPVNAPTTPEPQDPVIPNIGAIKAAATGGSASTEPVTPAASTQGAPSTTTAAPKPPVASPAVTTPPAQTAAPATTPAPAPPAAAKPAAGTAKPATPAKPPAPTSTPTVDSTTLAPKYTKTPGTAPVADAGADTVAGQLHDLLESGSPLLKQAEGNAEIQMNARGLQNSSLATQAADQAVIAAALPIAQQDAGFVQQSKLLAQQLANATQLTSEQQQNWLQQNLVTYKQTLATMSTQQGYNLQLAYIQQASALQSGLLNAITQIGSTQGLTPQQQQGAVAQLEAQYQADMNGLSSYFANSPEWNSAWGGKPPKASATGSAVAPFSLIGAPPPPPGRSNKDKLTDPLNLGPSVGLSNEDMVDPITTGAAKVLGGLF